MSGIPPEQGSPPENIEAPPGVQEKLRRIREERALKTEAARIARAQSNPASARALVSKAPDPRLTSSSISEAISFSPLGHQQQPLSPAARALPPLTWVADPQPLPHVGRASPASGLAGGPQPLSPVSHSFPASTRAGPQVMYPMSHASSISSRVGGSQPVSPTALTGVPTQGSRPASGTASPSGRGQSRLQVQPPGLPVSRAGTNTPDIIPDKLAYQVREEPDRLEVQPALISTELPLPMRASQSVPHTPATPSRLSLHKEASSMQTVTLEPKNLGINEYIVPLCMQKRILKQYVDTIEYYPASIKEIMKERTISEKTVEKLNQLLCRLANVSTHIGLEGGGPSSQDSVRSDQEAVYAEMSSEKFKFLGQLFNTLRGDDLHLAVVAEPGPLHDTLELFLKGKRVHYNRPSTYSKSTLGPQYGKLHVSVIASKEEGQTIHLTRPADLVIALDETFKAENGSMVNLRRKFPSGPSIGPPSPVIRLIVYSSVEHLDLCLPRTLESIDRLRRLIFCVWHTQSIVGELQDEPTTRECVEGVSLFLRRGGLPDFWSLPPIRPIENIPLMDSDSSLSDAMSDVSVKVGKPYELTQKFWPNKAPATIGITSAHVLSGGKRPFDLEYGDSFETQAKKQKMARNYHAGKPLDEPHTVENLKKSLKEVQAREQHLLRKNRIQEETIISFRNGAERRQGAYEDLRDKCSSLHHDKIDLNKEVTKLKKDLEKARDDRMALQGERGRLNKDLEDVRQQLLNNPNPLIAQKAHDDATIRDLSIENAALKKKLEFANTQFEYMKEQYGEASNRAVYYAKEIEDLKKKIEPLEGCLQHERDRRKYEREHNPTQPLVDKINTLKEELKRTEESTYKIIMKKEKEIEDLKRGRNAGVQTRGSSVQPRSPRGGSRGVSPAAGLLGPAPFIGKGPSGLNRPLNFDE